CGGGSDDSSTTGGGGEPSTTAGSEVSGKITVWDVWDEAFPDYTKAAKVLDEEFEKEYPNVTVEHVAQPFENYEALLQAAFTGHEGPDVMMMVPGKQGVLRWTQGLENLDDRITPDMLENLTGWATMTEGFQEEGEHYAVPIGVSGETFYYN